LPFGYDSHIFYALYSGDLVVFSAFSVAFSGDPGSSITGAAAAAGAGGSLILGPCFNKNGTNYVSSSKYLTISWTSSFFALNIFSIILNTFCIMKSLFL
jgi:hypothetical protein